MKRIIILFIIPMFTISCSETPKLEGLWELQDVSVDMIPRNSRPIYIEFQKGGSFSVSRENGDLVGLYRLNKNDLSFTSTGQTWFNTSWTANVYRNELVLEGKEYGYRTTELRFKQVEKFPSFDEFQKKLSGNWELYKIGHKNTEKAVSNMQFIITEEAYAISQNDSLIEQGRVLIDTRHQKISFENEETIWNARFVWNELRLENSELGISYRLRRTKE